MKNSCLVIFVSCLLAFISCSEKNVSKMKVNSVASHSLVNSESKVVAKSNHANRVVVNDQKEEPKAKKEKSTPVIKPISKISTKKTIKSDNLRKHKQNDQTDSGKEDLSYGKLFVKLRDLNKEQYYVDVSSLKSVKFEDNGLNIVVNFSDNEKLETCLNLNKNSMVVSSESLDCKAFSGSFKENKIWKIESNFLI